MPLRDLDHEQSAYIGKLIVTVHQAQEAHFAEERALFRAELTAVTAAWRALWEKAGCPAGAPE